MKNTSTNEAFQRRIEAVQWGRGTTHAECVTKRSLREQLEKDMAELDVSDEMYEAFVNWEQGGGV